MPFSLWQCHHKPDRHFSPFSSLHDLTAEGIADLSNKSFEFQVYRDAGGNVTSISFAAMLNDPPLTKMLKAQAE